MRMAGHDVLMVSGTDEHGTPIQVQADKEGVTAARARRPVQPGDRRGPARPRACPTTCSPAPRPATTTPWRRSCSAGCTATATSSPKTTLGAISPSTGRTLPDRYIEGTCPICGYDGARGDQCDNCGNQLDPDRPDQPASARSTARRRSSSRPSTSSSTCRRSPRRSAPGCDTRDGWRPNVLQFSLNLLDDLQPRAITRDLDWGVPVPLDGLAATAPDKRHLRLVRRGDRLPVGLDRVGPPLRRPRRLAQVVAATAGRTPRLLLHGQGQHRLPLRDLAGDAARLQRRGRRGRHAGRRSAR